MQIKNLKNADIETIRMCALNLLARREHSEQELLQKLLTRNAEPIVAQDIIDDLTKRNLISNDRFAESLVRACIRKGQGPIKLTHEFKKHNIDTAKISSLLTTLEIDWVTEIEKVHQQKYGLLPPSSPQDKLKRQRFLQNRGFSFDLMRSLWD